MAGGTGGHVFPALAVAERLRALGVAVVWLGSQGGLEAQLVPQHGFPLERIAVAGLRASTWWRWIGAPLMLTRALWQAGGVLRRLQPRLALGMGGFASGPGGVAARCLGVPLLIHEQNAIPGTTNRWLARIATRVLEAFPGSFPSERRALTVGNPVRASIAALPEPGERLAGRSGRLRLLVLGGSQGAAALNERVPAALALLPAEQRPEVWHQTGARLHQAALTAYEQAGVTAQLTPFIADMAGAYGWADVALCRAGALTVAELAAAGLGALLVPFPYAIDDHQSANARFLERQGAARVLPQASLTPQLLAQRLQDLLSDRGGLLRIAQAARALARSDAAERVAALCVEYSLNRKVMQHEAQ
jgi:UDP-N-acetylglucosamine--N-acetylmuramyl-(pentapeptide) pyrophosphoryl-undecaprenol N-acetylglucosamine transferase